MIIAQHKMFSKTLKKYDNIIYTTLKKERTMHVQSIIILSYEIMELELEGGGR